MRRLRTLNPLQAAKKLDYLDLTSSSSEPSRVSKSLVSALPNNVIFPHDAEAFKRSMDSYWAQQECEVVPACVVRPRDLQQLCTAVTLLKREYDEQEKQAVEGKAEALFAIRSGGHSPISGAASIKGGVVIDLGLFCGVTASEDGSTVTIGAGAKWMDVSKILEEKGLAVVGGRNSAVGVGGLTLGGKLLPFTSVLALIPHFNSESDPQNPHWQLYHPSVPELTQKHNRRSLLLLPPLRPSLLQRSWLRNRPRLWFHHHRFCIDQP